MQDSKLKKIRICSVITFIIAVINVIVEVTYKFFSSKVKEAINVDVFLLYCLVSMALLFLSTIVFGKRFFTGIASVLKLKKNYDAPISFALFASAIQIFCSLLTYINGDQRPIKIYSSLVVISVFLDFYSQYLCEKRHVDNLRFFSVPAIKRSIRLMFIGRLPLEISKEYGAKLCYTQRTNSFNNIGKIANVPGPGDSIAYNTSNGACIFALVIGFLHFLIYRKFFDAISVIAVSICMSIPVSLRLASNLSIKKVSKDCSRFDGFIGGFSTIKRLGNVRGIIVKSTDLYPRRKITLQGIKTFNGSKLDDALVYSAALVNFADSPLSVILSKIVRGKRVNSLHVHSANYEDETGLVGWVNGRRVIIGNREILVKYGFTPPSHEFEKKHTGENRILTYFAIDYELVAMFVLSYSPNLDFASELKKLGKLGVKLFVRTIDCNITSEMIAKDFGVYYDSVEIISNTNNVHLSKEIDTELSSDEAYAATYGTTKSFFRIIISCIMARLSILLGIIISTVSIVLGVSLSIFLMFYTTIDHLGSFELLLYIILWTCCAALVPEIILYLRKGK